MRILLGLIMVAMSTYLGYLFSLKYTTKKNFYCDFLTFHKKLKNEVSFSSNSVQSIVAMSLERNAKSQFNSVLDCYFNKNSKKDFKLDKHVFSNDDREYVEKYMENIGALDKKTQLEFLSSCDAEIKEKVDKCEINAKKYKSLCVKLGFLIGLIRMIILI